MKRVRDLLVVEVVGLSEAGGVEVEDVVVLVAGGVGEVVVEEDEGTNCLCPFYHRDTFGL